MINPVLAIFCWLTDTTAVTIETIPIMDQVEGPLHLPVLDD